MYRVQFIQQVSGEVKCIRIFAGDHPSEGVKVRHSHVDSENLTNNQLTWKRCKIEGKLLIITNRKSHMGFQLIPKSVT